MGGIFGAEAAAERWCAAFEAEYAALRACRRGPRARCLYCIWQDPWMTVSRDTYIAACWPNSAGRCRALDAGALSALHWSQELVDGLDAVLLSTEPYRFTEAHADALEKQLGIPVLLVDGEMMSWYGSRALGGCATCAAAGDAGGRD
jgi:hypothetical protein